MNLLCQIVGREVRIVRHGKQCRGAFMHRIARPRRRSARRLSSVIRVALVCSGIASSSVAASAAGQSNEVRPVLAAPRWALGVTMDGGYLPDDFALRCRQDGAPSVGGGASLVFHPKRWLVLVGDTRASAMIPNMHCATVVIPGIWPSGFVVVREKVFPDDAPRAPLWRSGLRIGLETPSGRPFVRATMGGGAIWTGRPTPFGTATVGLGARGRRTGLVAEVEVGTTQFRIAEQQSHFVDPGAVPRNLDYVTTSTPLLVRPVWANVHVGVEVGLGR